MTTFSYNTGKTLKMDSEGGTAGGGKFLKGVLADEIDDNSLTGPGTNGVDVNFVKAHTN